MNRSTRADGQLVCWLEMGVRNHYESLLRIGLLDSRLPLRTRQRDVWDTSNRIARTVLNIPIMIEFSKTCKYLTLQNQF